MIPRYDLRRLGWYNFETLVKTLLKALIGAGVESHGGSRDKGRDAIYRGPATLAARTVTWDGLWIFQAKHSEVEALQHDTAGQRFYLHLQKELRSTLQRHPDVENYVLFCSPAFSSGFRDHVRKIPAEVGYTRNFVVYDGQEICEFLDLYPQVRKSFPQLLAIADLKHILNADVHNRSSAFLENWQPRLQAFVSPSFHLKATDILEQYHFVVLDGPPEAGKTTIGAAISLQHVVDGFECYIVNKPNEIMRVYNKDKKQLFFADDAIGAISFDVGIGNQWGADLASILHRLNSTHKLIWTARTYILQEAIQKTKISENVPIIDNVSRVTVAVTEYSTLEKTMIFYNHAKLHGLSAKGIELTRELAWTIINNPNFTPYRAEYIVKHILAGINSGNKKSDTINAITDYLKDPGAVFQRAFTTLAEEEQELLLCLIDLGSRVKNDQLREEFDRRACTL